ncbi:MAG TPA: hypothetical protein PLY56_18630, partial [Armatimonadota bacterium]|nr:hypothetical protein [Armatimonadota bacterium]
MKITVIGTGYVGLVQAVGLAELGHEVVGMDHDVAKVRREILVKESANSYGKVRADFLPLYRVKRGGRLYPPADRTL